MDHKQYLSVIHLEDDALDAELIRAELDHHQIVCRVDRVRTQAEFESSLRSIQPDVILSDSSLPGFNTWLALALVADVYRSIPFIFVSGRCSPELKVEAISLGATDYVSKSNLMPLVRQLRRIWKLTIQLPEVEEPVEVQCRGFQCLGFLDDRGIWRNYKNSWELRDVVFWRDT